MRDLVYVSRRKLRVLGLDDHRRFLDRIKAGLKVSILGNEATVDVEPKRRRVIQLKRAEERLRKEKAVRFFSSASMADQWIYFEAPIGYGVIDDLAVFLDVAEQGAGYSSEGSVRLLLHGSARHMTESNLLGTSVEELSSEAAKVSNLDAESYASIVNPFVDHLREAMSLDVNEGQDDGWFSCKNWMRGERKIVQDLLPPLGRQLRLPYTAGWMSGLAMVTAVVPLEQDRNVVFATPLAVERMSSPCDS